LWHDRIHSPEMIRGEPYGQATDWWSVGILMFDMLSGDPPFRNKNRKRLQDEILTKKIKLNRFWRPPTHAILKALIERDVNKRIKLVDIKRHPFFKTVNWETMMKKEVPPPIKPHHKDIHDLSNFDPIYTSQAKSFSPAGALSRSQNELFANFSYVGRDFTPSTPETTCSCLVPGTPEQGFL